MSKKRIRKNKKDMSGEINRYLERLNNLERRINETLKIKNVTIRYTVINHLEDYTHLLINIGSFYDELLGYSGKKEKSSSFILWEKYSFKDFSTGKSTSPDEFQNLISNYNFPSLSAVLIWMKDNIDRIREELYRSLKPHLETVEERNQILQNENDDLKTEVYNLKQKIKELNSKLEKYEQEKQPKSEIINEKAKLKKITDLEDFKRLYLENNSSEFINPQMESVANILLDNRNKVLYTKDVRIKSKVSEATTIFHLKKMAEFGIIEHPSRGKWILPS